MMAKKPKIKCYKVHWSLDIGEREGGTISIPADDVRGMSEEERDGYFQECVDEEVKINGPVGLVDSVSVDEIE